MFSLDPWFRESRKEPSEREWKGFISCERKERRSGSKVEALEPNSYEGALTFEGADRKGLVHATYIR